MSRHFKVHELLDERELEDLRAYAREPARTIDEVHTWLLERGYTLSRGAVHNWKQANDEELIRERMSGAGSLAKAFMEAAKDTGGLAVPDAAVLQVAQMVFEAGTAMGGKATPGDLNKMALTLQRLMLAKSRLEQTRSEFEDREREALAEAGKVASAGGDGKSVLEKVEEILGVKKA